MVHKHPKYVSSKKYNDIALFELASEAVINQNVKPACLHTSTQMFPDVLQIT